MCPRPASEASATAVTSPPPALGFADPQSLSEAEPLALYDVRWLLLAGESGALTEAQPALHSFTLGHWECALSAEEAQDTFTGGHAQVQRQRRIACTHPTGLTMQSELSCRFAMPARAVDGSPRMARREARIALGDAPPLTLACEPFATEQLELVRGAREPVAKVCVRDGSVAPCSP